MEIDEIKKLKEYYVKGLYSKTRAEQKIDCGYIEDTFPVPEVRSPHRPVRSGRGYEIVNAPAEHIITSNPLAFFDVIGGTKPQDVALRLSKEINRSWIKLLKKQNPNPFKESVKNKLSRGENYIQLVHNEAWVTGKKERIGLPVLFLVHDPMVIYGSPEEDEEGIPSRVIVLYNRQPSDVILRYPGWSNPKRKTSKKSVEWFEYWDKETWYCEADDEPVRHQENLYGFTPFIRKYSGFGRRSPDGELSSLIVSDIRMSRDLIKEECITRSDIASIHHLFSHRSRLLRLPMGQEISEDEIDELQFGAYALNVIHLPVEASLSSETVELPGAELYAYLNEIITRIQTRHPFVMAGFPFGTSGRQQGMTLTAGMRRYDTVIENTTTEWATAFEKALLICKRIPTLKPDGLKEADLNAQFRCQVELRASDPIEADRLATLGDRQWNGGNGAIDLRTNLVKYQGYTEDEAEEIIIRNLVDKVTLFNPEIAQIIGMEAAEEMGMGRHLEELQRQRQAMEGMQRVPPRTTTERIKGEVQTELGQEIGIEPGRGMRRPPSRYTRGGEV